MTALAGRVALVTGASRGIGLAIARMLVGDGARVAMLARGADELSARAAELGSSAVPMPCDVGNWAAIDRVAREVRTTFGGAPDIVVNNAGFFLLAALENTQVDDVRRALDLNVVGPFALLRAFLAEMRARRSGDIVTIGSIADHVIYRENGAYAAGKFAARALHEVLRVELRGSGVRATLVSPGPVDTALWDEIDPDTRAGFTPRRAMLPAEAVAQAVRYAVLQPRDTNIEELRLSHS